MSAPPTITLKSARPVARPGSPERGALIVALRNFLDAGHGRVGEVVAADALLHSLLNPSQPRSISESAERAEQILNQGRAAA